MVIGVLLVDLYIPNKSSLKGKRMIIRSLKTRLRNKFNLAVSEVDHNDLWQRAGLALVGVSNGGDGLVSMLNSALHFIEREKRVQVLDYSIQEY